MSDPAEIRAEGRRLLTEAREIGWPPDLPRTEALNKHLTRHADVLLADPASQDRDEGRAIAIISNVDAPEVGWPHQTEEWRTAARSWLDAVHAPAP